MQNKSFFYFVVVGDIRNSRDISDRKEIQKKFKNVLTCVNRDFEKQIASKFTISLGDEFQGVLQGSAGRSVFEIISAVKAEMYPIRFRFGVGAGTISTELSPESPIEADGPAFHLAREAIDGIHRKETQNSTYAGDICVRFTAAGRYVPWDAAYGSTTRQSAESSAAGNADIAELLLNENLALMSLLEKSWTTRGREIIDIFRLGRAKNQAEAAALLGISQPAVQQSLRNSSYYAYAHAFDTVCAALAAVGQERRNSEGTAESGLHAENRLETAEIVTPGSGAGREEHTEHTEHAEHTEHEEHSEHKEHEERTEYTEHTEHTERT